MTISKKLKSRSESRGTLEYVYRGEKSHPVIGKKGNLLLDNARHIGGQISSPDPFQYGADCKPNQVKIDDLASELDLQVTKYRGLGSGKNLIQHYVISLAPGESLSDSEWRKAVKLFMDEMGYGNDTLYTACVHTEKDHEHAHIVACRVKHNGKLVQNQNDYAKAVKASRKVEIVFGLKITPNPEETMGVDSPPGDVPNEQDAAVIIRKRINTVFDAKKTMPQMTMSDFVNLLKEQGVQVKVKLNKDEQPIGINYSLDGNLWISGSKIKKTRTTWKALLATEMIDYKPVRDNVALGIGGAGVTERVKQQILDVPQEFITGDSAEICLFVKLSQKQKAFLQKRHIIAIYQNKIDKNYYAYLRFNVQRPDGYDQNPLITLSQAFFKLLLMVLNIIFGLVLSAADDVDFIVSAMPDVKYDFSLFINDGLDSVIQTLQNELEFIDDVLINKELKALNVKSTNHESNLPMGFSV